MALFPLMLLMRSCAVLIGVSADSLKHAVKVNKPMLDRMSAAVLERLGDVPSGRVLDLASGIGEPSVTLASLHPGLQIVCTDIHLPFNERAMKRASEAGVNKEMTFATTSADDLSAFEDNMFDAVMMSNGLMFIPDGAKCLREIHRVLKPGGFAHLSVWKDLTMYNFAREVIDQVSKKKTPDFAINPMKYKDAGAVEDLAKGASLEIVSEEMMSYPTLMGPPRTAADGLAFLAGATLKDLVDADGDAMDRFYKIVESEAESRGWTHSGVVTIPDNKAQLLTLRKKPIENEEL